MKKTNYNNRKDGRGSGHDLCVREYGLRSDNCGSTLLWLLNEKTTSEAAGRKKKQKRDSKPVGFTPEGGKTSTTSGEKQHDTWIKKTPKLEPQEVLFFFEIKHTKTTKISTKRSQHSPAVCLNCFFFRLFFFGNPSVGYKSQSRGISHHS